MLGHTARGAMRNADMYIQTLWLVPLYAQEHAALQAGQEGQLELGVRGFDFRAADPARPSLV